MSPIPKVRAADLGKYDDINTNLLFDVHPIVGGDGHTQTVLCTGGWFLEVMFFVRRELLSILATC